MLMLSTDLAAWSWLTLETDLAIGSPDDGDREDIAGRRPVRVPPELLAGGAARLASAALVLWSRRSLAARPLVGRPLSRNEDMVVRPLRSARLLSSLLALCGLAACGPAESTEFTVFDPKDQRLRDRYGTIQGTDGVTLLRQRNRRPDAEHGRRRRRRRRDRRQRLSVARYARDPRLHADRLGRSVRRADHHRLVSARRRARRSG